MGQEIELDCVGQKSVSFHFSVFVSIKGSGQQDVLPHSIPDLTSSLPSSHSRTYLILDLTPRLATNPNPTGFLSPKRHSVRGGARME